MVSNSFAPASSHRRSLVEPRRPSERSERARFAGCLPFFRVGQGGVLEKQEASAEEAGFAPCNALFNYLLDSRLH